MKKKITLLLSIIMLLQFVSVSAATIEDNRTILYVAVEGNDSADGSINNPFATIKRARDEIRDLKKNGEIGPKGAVVYIRGGVYQQFETVELNEEDGGNDGAPIVYRGYPGEEVKIIGGINIPTNKIKKTEDAQVLAKVIEPSAKNNIYEVDLFDVGFKDVPKIFYAEVYGLTTAAMYKRDPENVAVELLKKKNMDITTSAFEILVDNDVYSNARYPDEDKGRLIIERGIKSSFISGEGRYSELIKTYLNDTVTEKPVFFAK